MTTTFSAEHVKQSSVPGEYLYLLLDPLAGCERDHPLHPEKLREALGEDDVTTVMRADLAHTPSACPRLVVLAHPDGSFREDILERSLSYAERDVFYDKRYICGWLSSAQEPHVLSVALAEHCLVQAGSKHRFLPLFEPLRTELLAATSKEDAEFWLDLASVWLCPTAHGGAARLKSGSHTGISPSARAIRVQDDVPYVSALLAAWRDLLTQPLTYAPQRWQGKTVLPPQAAVQAWRQIRDARAYGLTQLKDLLIFALHRWTIHPHIDKHPRVRTDIKRAARGEASLADLFDAYNDSTWAHIAHAVSAGEN